MTATSADDTDLYTDTITMLTRAATRHHTDGTTADFADFLAQVLAATAANSADPTVSSPDDPTRGKPAT